MQPAVLTLSWAAFPERPPGSSQVAFSRRAIAQAIDQVLPGIRVDPRLLTFVQIGDGRTQVNVHGFGPFGVLSVPAAQ